MKTLQIEIGIAIGCKKIITVGYGLDLFDCDQDTVFDRDERRHNTHVLNYS